VSHQKKAAISTCHTCAVPALVCSGELCVGSAGGDLSHLRRLVQRQPLRCGDNSLCFLLRSLELLPVENRSQRHFATPASATAPEGRSPWHLVSCRLSSPQELSTNPTENREPVKVMEQVTWHLQSNVWGNLNAIHSRYVMKTLWGHAASVLPGSAVWSLALPVGSLVLSCLL
jgi:hypothetical protein